MKESGLVKIRLMRMGAKRDPFYRVVVAKDTTPRGGRYIDLLGTYNPKTNPQTVELKEDRVFHWLSNGAIPTDTVRSLLRQKGILRRWQEMKQGTGGERSETSDEAS